MPAVRQPGSKVTNRALRVLLAEDDPVNQLVARRMLEMDGHVVTVVADGDQALRALETGGVDVALMDIQMPELDGLDASRTWRERESGGGARVPIIALTAHAMESDRERALAAGMDGYLTKPLRLEELRAALTAHVPGTPADPAQDPAVGMDGVPEVTEGAAFTRDRFLHAVEGEEDLLAVLARVWDEQGAGMVGAVEGALRAGGGVALESAAHRLKGAALALGAEALADAAGALEAAAREGRAAPQEEARRLRTAADAVDRVVRKVLTSAG